MSFDGVKTAADPNGVSETKPGELVGDVQDARVAPLHRNLKSRHLQMIGSVLSW